jgi:hypothetical protein
MIRFLLSAIVILAQATAFADGGAVQFRKEAGNVVITLFTAPASLSVGPADISLLVQNRDGLDPVLNADVSLKLREAFSGIEFEARPTRAKATNKLLYAVPVMFAKPGKWLIAVRVAINGKTNDANGVLVVAPAPASSASYAGYIALPPVMILLFVVREALIRRKQSKG